MGAIASCLALALTAASLPARAEPEPEPGDADPTTLDNLASWEEDEDETLPEPAPAVAAPAVAPPPTPLPDREQQRRRKVAEGFAIAGAVFLGAGGMTWVLLSLPAAIAGGVAESRDPVLGIPSEAELHARAERRYRFARTTFLAGLGMAAVGGIMLGAGLGTRAKIDRQLSAGRPRTTLHLHPTLGRDGAGAALVLRH
jgi:hypothetical protein